MGMTVYNCFQSAQYYMNQILISLLFNYILIKMYKLFDYNQYINFLLNQPIRENSYLNE